MNSVVDEIKDRISISDLIQGYIKLQKSGVNFKARCPFHNEKTPSFFVSPERQIFKCFGCGEGGSIFDFVMKIEGLDFPEALRILAKRAGVELKKENKEFESHKTRLYEICDLTASFFEKQLQESNAGKRVWDYLIHERGLLPETIKKWRIGYAPNTWTALHDFLLNYGYKDDEILNAGLVIKNSQFSAVNISQHHDRFRSRIIFPIFDLNNQVVGFAGRIFSAPAGRDLVSGGGADVAKYINTPQTAIYDKSRILYGLHLAKQSVRQNDQCLVVEGNVDVIVAHQAGTENVVASSGTALTEGHLKIIKRYTENLDLCFDEDLAGDVATRRGIDLALENGFSVNVVRLTSQSSDMVKDPADFVKIYGADSWQRAIKNRVPIAHYYIETALLKHDSTTGEGKKAISNFVLPILALYENPVEQAHWLGILSSKLAIAESVLKDALLKIKGTSGFSTRNGNANGNFDIQSPGESRRNRLEESFLTLLLKTRKCILVENYTFSDPTYAKIYAYLVDNQKESEQDETFEKGLIDNNISNEYNILVLKAEELWENVENVKLDEEIQKIVVLLRKEVIKEELGSIQSLLTLVQAELSQEELSFYLARIRDLTKELI